MNLLKKSAENDPKKVKGRKRFHTVIKVKNSMFVTFQEKKCLVILALFTNFEHKCGGNAEKKFKHFFVINMSENIFCNQKWP